MPNAECPSCGEVIATEDINIAEGVGLCRACGQLSNLRDLVDDETPSRSDSIDLARGDPPSGAWLRDTGVETQIGATTRSSVSLFMWFFTLFWNSITGIFVAIALGSILHHLGFAPQKWNLPVSTNGGSSHPMSVGETIFMSLFLTPFVLIGLGTLWFALVLTIGKSVVTLRGDLGKTRTGIGPLSIRKTFRTSAINSVKIRRANSETNGKPDREIVLDGDEKTIKFGVMLTPARRRWMAAVLSELLVASKR